MWHTFADTSSSVDHARLECTHHGSHATVPRPRGRGMQRGEGNRIFMANFIDFNFANDKHFFARIPSWVPVATFDCCSVIRRMLRHVNSLFLPPFLSVCCMLMRAFLSAITISSSGVRGPQRNDRLAWRSKQGQYQ